MNLINQNQDSLRSVKEVIHSLGDDQYNEPLEILSASSIGAHLRHVLEFYICLLRETDEGVICYDDRERNVQIEKDRFFALQTIDVIIERLGRIQSDRRMQLKADFSAAGQVPTIMETSFCRELAYCLEHSVHHQALIKVGIVHRSTRAISGNTFGVAPSTVRHRAQQLS